MNNFKELQIWKRSIDLATKLYTLTSAYPKDEKFGLIDQIRRAGISVASNIAEGAGRNTLAQTTHFINIAFGSLCEIETQIIISSQLKYISLDEKEILINEIVELKKMTRSFLKSLKKS